MDYAQLFLGQIPEAVYFALFIILCKKEKVISKKSVALILLSIFQYLVLAYTFPYNSWFQFIYFFALYVNIKFLWKEITITDLFLILYAFLFLVITSIITFGVVSMITTKTYIISIIHKLIMFIFVFIYKNKFHLIKSIHLKYWNRNDEIKKNIKTITFRTIHILSINILFIVINLCIIYALIYNSR